MTTRKNGQTTKAMDVDDSRETANLLELATAQIDMSMQESEQSIEDLITAMTAVSARLRSIEKVVEQAWPGGMDSMARDAIHDACTMAGEHMQCAVVAFQFYDRLVQRIGHVRDNLNGLSTVIQSPTGEHCKLWQRLHERTRSVYSLEQEQVMYQALIKGLSAESAMQSAQPRQAAGASDIELF